MLLQSSFQYISNKKLEPPEIPLGLGLGTDQQLIFFVYYTTKSRLLDSQMKLQAGHRQVSCKYQIFINQNLKIAKDNLYSIFSSKLFNPVLNHIIQRRFPGQTVQLNFGSLIKVNIQSYI
ncbi:Hypothetical_protein [Hexamita inflata]|uniref:Hypothetical_protein n=1 Tax=Hexamita inflata TaxID=28002 RepID=A0AA86NR24_9EUKA|nr:Hypothetical protein HINF_LOCUS11827 [Hexamita inflata]